jgi:hypothetical protein
MYCDICDRNGTFSDYQDTFEYCYLCGFQGFYCGTDIPVSYLYKTDLQSFYWSEPMCYECNQEWTMRYKNYINTTILKAVITIQRLFRHTYWSPPKGKGFLKTQSHFNITRVKMTAKMSET